MTNMATPKQKKKNPDPESWNLLNFGRPFLGHHFHTLGLSDPCQGVEKKIFKEIMHSSLWTNITKPLPRSHEICNSSDPSLVSIKMYSVCLIYTQQWIRPF